MAVLTKAEIESLSPEERLALIDELWDSFDRTHAATAAEPASLPEWQRKVLDERLADLEANPKDDLSVAEARKDSLI
jgi:putative addiction module component (TIGR02574 family)